MAFKHRANLAKSSRHKRGGKLDFVNFKVAEVHRQTEQALDVASAFEHLGGVYDICGKTLDVPSVRVESVEPVRKERGLVFLTKSLVSQVHEPDHLADLVSVKYEKLDILRPESE